MKKVTRTFSVDEEVYKGLSAFFKKYAPDAGMSSFVNKWLSGLSAFLREAEAELKANRSLTVPMSFIIDALFADESIFSIHGGSGFDGARLPADMAGDLVGLMVYEWQEDYEAHQKNIPPKFYYYLKRGYSLSEDKKYVIDASGEKFVPVAKNLLAPLDSLKEVGSDSGSSLQSFRDRQKTRKK